MKRLLFIAAFLSIGIFAHSQMECRSFSYRQKLLARSPEIASAVEAIEAFTKNLKDSKSTATNDLGGSGKTLPLITIPVVVHILFNSSDQNISDAQIRSQIDVLNNDYRRQNADTDRTPEIFHQFAADCGFQFELAQTDPFGYATTGIVHKHTSIVAFNIEDGIKFSKTGGDDAWDRDNYLNIWVGSLENGILGYSSVVGCHKENDGIVVQFNAFGTLGTARAPFNKGRTATHELGHWLNLIHVWGDADCGNDLVDDTPPQQNPHRGCPGNIQISCGNGPYGDMYMNYMDFTDDGCMNIFTLGQRDRMQALFVPGGPRYNLLFSTALTAVPKPLPANSLSLQDNSNNALQTFPNPATDIISVEVSNSTNIGSTLEIFDGMGVRILTTRMDCRQQQVNIASLRSGIYYLVIVDGKNRITLKLVKI